jgi:hypothetical protein
METKPGSCLLYESSRYTRVDDLSWKSWGGKRAVAKGKIYGKGAPQPTRIKFVLSRLNSIENCNTRWYAKATIHILSGPSRGREISYNRAPASNCTLD